MKTIFTFLIALMLQLSMLAQVPQAINYQAVARNMKGEALKNQQVAVKINIIRGNPLIMSSPLPKHVVYSETHEVTTNAFGLFNIAVGQGWSHDNFSGIRWNRGPFFLEVELDPSGGEDYHSMGMSQILSVPYAMYAEKAGSIARKKDNLVLTSPDNKKWALTVDNEGQLSTKPLRHKKWYRGTVKDYTGLDGCRYIIELDNGKKLEPHSLAIDSTFQFYDGQRVKVQFTRLDNMASICMVGEMVRIDKIEEISGMADRCRKVTEDAQGGSFPMDPVSVEDIFLRGNCLLIKVGYSGGCETHEFELLKSSNNGMPGSPALNDSSIRWDTPVFRLSHDAHGDLCEAYIRDTLRFDVSPYITSSLRSFNFTLYFGDQQEQYALPVNPPFHSGIVLHHTACKDFSTDDGSHASPDNSIVEYSYENGHLRLKHINAAFNCCAEELYVNVIPRGDTLFIKEDEKSSLCDCYCLYDLTMRMPNLEKKEYTLIFKEPYYQGDNPIIFSIDLNEQTNGRFAVERTGHYPWHAALPGDSGQESDSLLIKKLHRVLQHLPENWSGQLFKNAHDSIKIRGVPKPLMIAEFKNPEEPYEMSGNKYDQQLVLYFYSIEKKNRLDQLVEKSMMYSWCIPATFKETNDYYIITSPCYHRLNCKSDNTGGCKSELINILNDDL